MRSQAKRDGTRFCWADLVLIGLRCCGSWCCYSGSGVCSSCATVYFFRVHKVTPTRVMRLTMHNKMANILGYQSITDLMVSVCRRVLL